jgi:hypothetical protein
MRDAVVSVHNLLLIRWKALRGDYDHPIASSASLTVWPASPESGAAPQAR